MTRGRAQAAKARKKRALKKVHKAARAVAAHSHTDAGPDRIVCLLCGETYRAVNYSHLRWIHGMEGPHPIKDYKETFGLRVAMCEETRELVRDVQIRRHKKAGRHWTKVRMVRQIRRLRGPNHALAYSRVPEAMAQVARRLYGSWDAALLAAGVDPATQRLTRTWDRKRLISALHRYASRGGRISASWVKERDPELYGAALRLLGNWSSAIRAADLDPHFHREPQKWCMKHVVAWVRKTHAAGGDVRSSAAPTGAVNSVAREARGPWSRFVESLGIAYPGTKPRLDWTNAAVLGRIRARRREGLLLHTAGVLRDENKLYTQGVNRFGSWDAALRAAGLVPERIRMKRTWTRKEVLAAIRARERARKSMRYRYAMADDSRLVQAAQRMFPTSWGRALVAAGIDPSRARTDAASPRARPRRRK